VDIKPKLTWADRGILDWIRAWIMTSRILKLLKRSWWLIIHNRSKDSFNNLLLWMVFKKESLKVLYWWITWLEHPQTTEMITNLHLVLIQEKVRLHKGTWVAFPLTIKLGNKSLEISRVPSNKTQGMQLLIFNWVWLIKLFKVRILITKSWDIRIFHHLSATTRRKIYSESSKWMCLTLLTWIKMLSTKPSILVTTRSKSWSKCFKTQLAVASLRLTTIGIHRKVVVFSIMLIEQVGRHLSSGVYLKNTKTSKTSRMKPLIIRQKTCRASNTLKVFANSLIMPKALKKTKN